MVTLNQLNCKDINITFEKRQKINCDFFQMEIKNLDVCINCKFKTPKL
jgi:hypothetical protein